jgi:pimeloyl-ACP methyl ester carboxylesterase
MKRTWVTTGIFKHSAWVHRNMHIARCLLLCLCLTSCSGATRLAFVPMQPLVLEPDALGLQWEAVEHLSLDHKTHLYSWWLPATTATAKGSVLFLHGNAENISTHIHSVKWLPQAGYNVFLLGYRGYGFSEGSPELPDILKDIASGARWISIRTPEQPLYVLGQSMGAALAVNFTATYKTSFAISGVALDACFRGLPRMAAGSLTHTPLTWILIPIGWAIMPSDFDPEDHIAAISPIPVQFFHSPSDSIVPYEHGKVLFQRAAKPKYWFDAKGKHIQTFNQPEAKNTLLQFFAKHQKL